MINAALKRKKLGKPIVLLRSRRSRKIRVKQEWSEALGNAEGSNCGEQDELIESEVRGTGSLRWLFQADRYLQDETRQPDPARQKATSALRDSAPDSHSEVSTLSSHSTLMD